MVHYANGNMFSDELAEIGVDVVRLPEGSVFGKVRALVRIIDQRAVESIIAFQDTPALLAALSGRIAGVRRIIISERQYIPDAYKPRSLRLKRYAYYLADVITTNSHANARDLITHHPLLRKRIRVVWNYCALIERKLRYIRPENSKVAHFVVLASHKPQKNLRTLLDACKLARSQRPDVKFHVSWYGGGTRAQLVTSRRLLEESGLESTVSFRDEVTNVEEILSDSAALILPSLWEGLPNAVCEAMSVGTVVIASNVSDLPLVIENGTSGFLFSPTCCRELAEHIVKVATMSDGERIEVGRAARESAEANFSEPAFIAQYLEALK
jgi:glycosyltransferase involved in cell wall biosynthesis